MLSHPCFDFPYLSAKRGLILQPCFLTFQHETRDQNTLAVCVSNRSLIKSHARLAVAVLYSIKRRGALIRPVSLEKLVARARAGFFIHSFSARRILNSNFRATEREGDKMPGASSRGIPRAKDR